MYNLIKIKYSSNLASFSQCNIKTPNPYGGEFRIVQIGDFKEAWAKFFDKQNILGHAQKYFGHL